MIDLSQWIATKAQTSPDKYLSASVRLADVSNKTGRDRPFNYQTAVNQFRGWIYAAVMMNAKAIAETPLRLYVRTKGRNKTEKLFQSKSMKYRPRQKRYMSGRLREHPSRYVQSKVLEWGDEYEEVTEQSPLLELLSKPNAYTLGFEFAMLRHMMASLTGNFFMHPVVERAGGISKPTELWVMPSQFVKIMPALPDSSELIQYYIYGINATTQRNFAPDEVKHMKFPNPRDFYYGLGQVEADWDAQKITIAQRETDQSRYDNLARPDLAVITRSSNMNISQLKEQQEEWMRLFRGTFRQGSPVFLSGDTDVIPLNFQPTEQGSREIIIEEHAAVFGVPVSLLKANDPNLASAQVGFASWRQMTILPYCRMDEEFLNDALLPMYGIEDDAFLCYDDPVPENRDEVRNDIQVAMQFGTKTRNEIRIAMGDDPIEEENADKLLVPQGLVPLENVGDMGMGSLNWSMGANGDSESNRGDATDEEPAKEEKILSRAKSLVVKQSDWMFEHRHKGDADDTVREGERERPIMEMRKSMSLVFRMQCRKLQAYIARGGKAKGLIDETMAILRSFDSEIADALAPYMQLQIENGGKQGMRDIQLPPDAFDISNTRVSEFIRHYMAKLAGEVNEYTWRLVSESLADGIAEGESASKLSARVGTVYDDFEGYRTEAIARSESARAFTEGTLVAWKESGVVEGKKWDLAPGACEVCRAIAAYHPKAIPLNQPFFELGSQIPLPSGKVFKVDYTAIMGPPGHPHDRCGISPVMVQP